MDFGKIIQFMIFMLVILVMAKIFGFANNGFAVLIACAVGGIAFVVINIISQRSREAKASKEEKKPAIPAKKNKKKNPKKKKSGTSR